MPWNTHWRGTSVEYLQKTLQAVRQALHSNWLLYVILHDVFSWRNWCPKKLWAPMLKLSKISPSLHFWLHLISMRDMIHCHHRHCSRSQTNSLLITSPLAVPAPVCHTITAQQRFAVYCAEGIPFVCWLSPNLPWGSWHNILMRGLHVIGMEASWT